MPKHVTIEEAATLLSVSTKTIQRRIESGTIKSKKKDNKRLILYESLGLPHTNDDGQENNNDGQNSSNKKTEKSVSEVEFLRQQIMSLESSRSKQDERLAEVSQLILNTQKTLTELNKTMLITSGQTRTGETDDDGRVADKNGQNKDIMSDNETKNDANNVRQGSNVPFGSKKALYWILGAFIVLLIGFVVYMLLTQFGGGVI